MMNEPLPTPDFRQFAARVRALHAALESLGGAVAGLDVVSPTGSEWWQLLVQKLLPQLDLPPLLVVAIVGGTNIGKSLIFNHVAGEVASGVSPLAAGTKHPVCLVPAGLDDPPLLARLFASFALRAWQSPADPLQEAAEDRLFWRVGNQVPPRLLLLDAPDIDSDATVNWHRADSLRQAADVVVAVLTQQKYNDAAVKRFFRMAVEADKPIVVIFNQLDLPADAAIVPQWLATFCQATAARPEMVYAVPHDRAAADALRLPFLRVNVAARGDVAAEPASPREDLGRLHFDAIKIRTFRGALKVVLDDQRGLPQYLGAIRSAASRFAGAAAALSATEMARVAWPTLPAGVLVDEVRAWWNDHRPAWSQRVHGLYRVVGRGVTWPLRTVWSSLTGPAVDPLVDFQQRERAAVLLAVEKLIDELSRLAEVGNETLRPRLARLLGGHARSTLLERVQAAHRNLPAVDDDYRAFLRGELAAWRADNPRALRVLQSLDHAAAIARPVLTITLFVTGLHLAGDLVGQAAAHAAGSTAAHLATEAAIAGGVAGGGEALVTTTSERVGQAAARLLLRLQSRYAQQRAAWLADWLERELLGDLLAELRRGAEVPAGQAFTAVEQAVAELRALAESSR